MDDVQPDRRTARGPAQRLLSGYGVAFTKTFARRRGANPVWYLDITPRPPPAWLTNPINELVAGAEQQATPAEATTPDPQPLARMPILRLTPFIEQMGPTQGGLSRKEFWWEREWRHVGNLDFTAQDIVVVFTPETDHAAVQERLAASERYRDKVPALVDARWGLERMIAALAAIRSEDVGPFPSS